MLCFTGRTICNKAYLYQVSLDRVVLGRSLHYLLEIRGGRRRGLACLHQFREIVSRGYEQVVRAGIEINERRTRLKFGIGREFVQSLGGRLGRKFNMEAIVDPLDESQLLLNLVLG